MKINTRIFGEVDIADEKIITFPQGIIGFPELNRFTLIFDEEKGVNAGIRWLQSVDEPNFAMPVMDPLFVKTDYNPQVEDEIFDTIGGIDNDEVLVLVTVTVPKEIQKMTVNLKGPIIINAVSRKAIQVIVEGDENEVKFPVYDILKARKDGE